MSTPPVRFGLQLPQEITDPGLLRELALEAERRGFHSLWLYDHLFDYPSAGNATILEAFTLMTTVAAWTRSIRVGTLVFCGAYRPPALLAKMAATLDVLSGGRLEFGYGAGWHETEHQAYGHSFPGAAERIDRMEEGLAILRAMWTEGKVSFHGDHYHLEGAVCEPRPLQRPHPPITIGGGGEKLLLRAVARHADWWNYYPGPLPEYEHKVEVLRRHCEREGRDPDGIRRSLVVPTVTAEWEKEVRDQLEGARARGLLWTRGTGYVQGTPDIVVPRFLDYARRGVSLFILVLPDPTDLKQPEFVERNIAGEFA
jgi:F420-dependent oxidoreductase-like protein